MPSISVILPVRNGAQFVEKAIRSILCQTETDFELIVIDDGSEDDTAEIIKKMGKIDGRLRCITLAHGGIVLALQAGIAQASAPLVARMDGDDIACPQRLALQRSFLQRHVEVVAVGGQINKIDSSGRLLARGFYPLESSRCRDHLMKGSPFCHPAVMMRTEALIHAGGYRSRYGNAEDYDLWLRLQRIGDLRNLPETVLLYRVHAQSVTSSKADANARDAALAYIEAFHATTIASDDRGAAFSAHTAWQTVETSLPLHLRDIARFAYLRALTLNGGITDPAATMLLLQSLEDRRFSPGSFDATDEPGFTLLRAAHQMRRAGRYGAMVKLLAQVWMRDPKQILDEARLLMRRFWI